MGPHMYAVVGKDLTNVDGVRIITCQFFYSASACGQFVLTCDMLANKGVAGMSRFSMKMFVLSTFGAFFAVSIDGIVMESGYKKHQNIKIR
jgi:hypothetical protein